MGKKSADRIMYEAGEALKKRVKEDGEQIESLQKELEEAKEQRDTLNCLAYEKTGVAFSEDMSFVFIDGIGELEVKSQSFIESEAIKSATLAYDEYAVNLVDPENQSLWLENYANTLNPIDKEGV